MELTRLEIVTPNGVIFDNDVKRVTLPGADGEFGVLPQHASLVSLLESGVIAIEKEDGSEVAVAIDSGYCKVDENKTLCIVEGAVLVGGDDSDLAASLEEVRKLLESAKASPTVIAAAVSKVERVAKA